MSLKPYCTSILSCNSGRAIAPRTDGILGPVSGQFTNWLFEPILGDRDSGIESRQSVANCTIFRSYATAVGKPG
ncbi:hypothetical protein [Tychonema sp. LEGE 07203]|uniref:hypothetical protein n=1 Tax=Tychonema sp. LEGE 07203 TaxID=1828671 RepID=UPI00187EFD9B|nr:hypothetical protein [Tychonema sp. LEGE 07203]MBE9094566.1 hypothetical protein [Tychonema sp. LEGE 07203]